MTSTSNLVQLFDNITVVALPSPQSHIEERINRLYKKIERLLSDDPYCSRGQGHKIAVPYYEDKVVSEVGRRLGLNWNINRIGPEVVVTPHEYAALGLLRTRIWKALDTWNSERGSLRIEVSDFDKKIVDKTVEILGRLGWETTILVEAEDRYADKKPETLVIIMPTPSEHASATPSSDTSWCGAGPTHRWLGWSNIGPHGTRC